MALNPIFEENQPPKVDEDKPKPILTPTGYYMPTPAELKDI